MSAAQLGEAGSAAAAQSKPDLPPLRFPKSPVPANPLGEGKYVKTAGCIIIGDEVLNGKTMDTNSNYFAKFCFNQGIELKRIEVIADDEDQIIEATRRMARDYDFCITSGGIGPTADDITYESIAKSFDAEPLQYHDETLRRMDEMTKRRPNWKQQTEEQNLMRKRMALFPSKNVEVIHPTEELWVPIVRVHGKVCILPGVPRLFEALIEGFLPYIPLDPNRPRPYRVLIHTSQPESSIAPYFARLMKECKEEEIKAGSYPKWNGGVDVSLIGNDLDRLLEIAKGVEKEIEGEIIAQGKVGDEKKTASL